MSTGWKLAIGGLLIAGVTSYVAYLGASTSWRYYLTVDECVDSAGSLVGQRVRVSGKVSPGTLRIAADRKHADFSLQGDSARPGSDRRLVVACSGTVPANLAEDLDVVVEGRLDESGTLRGDGLLTRCSSKYTAKSPAGAPPPPEKVTGTFCRNGPEGASHKRCLSPFPTRRPEGKGTRD